MENEDLAKVVRDAIKRRYREEFVIYEFKDLPANPSHYMDALVINLHPSRSTYIESIEIKTHRSDWLNELKNPDIRPRKDWYWLTPKGQKRKPSRPLIVWVIRPEPKEDNI